MIPNLITFIRLLAVPALIFLMLSTDPADQIWGVIVFGAAALTDWLDGWLARSTDQITKLGMILDPLADRMLVITAVVCLGLLKVLPLWALTVLLVREIIIVVGYLFLSQNKITLVVSWIGKTATALLLISIFILLTGQIVFRNIVLFIGSAMFYSGLFLYILAAIDYLKKGINLLKRSGLSEKGKEDR